MIVIYPYAHLSSSLSSPDSAKKILKDMEDTLKKKEFNVQRVPFGWYKSFEVSCKGHPLSELSRTITSNKKSEDNADLKTETEKSTFYVLTGKEIVDPAEFTFENKDLKQLVDYELGQSESSGEEPPHVKLMREKKLADYEPSADVGHLRWYPNGNFISNILSDYVYNLVTDRGAMPVGNSNNVRPC